MARKECAAVAVEGVRSAETVEARREEAWRRAAELLSRGRTARLAWHSPWLGDGRRLSLRFGRPWVRALDGRGGLELSTYKQAQDPRFFTEAVLAECLVRVFQREYRG